MPTNSTSFNVLLAGVGRDKPPFDPAVSRLSEALGSAVIFTPLPLLKTHKYERPPLACAADSSLPQWAQDLLAECVPLLTSPVHGLQFAAYNLLQKWVPPQECPPPFPCLSPLCGAFYGGILGIIPSPFDFTLRFLPLPHTERHGWLVGAYSPLSSVLGVSPPRLFFLPSHLTVLSGPLFLHILRVMPELAACVTQKVDRDQESEESRWAPGPFK